MSPELLKVVDRATKDPNARLYSLARLIDPDGRAAQDIGMITDCGDGAVDASGTLDGQWDHDWFTVDASDQSLCTGNASFAVISSAAVTMCVYVGCYRRERSDMDSDLFGLQHVLPQLLSLFYLLSMSRWTRTI